MSEQYHFAPDTISRMTLPQVYWYIKSSDPAARKDSGRLGEAMMKIEKEKQRIREEMERPKKKPKKKGGRKGRRK